MPYDEVWQIIAKYSHDDLHLFADHWSRFPQHPRAAIIAGHLRDKAKFFGVFDQSIADLCSKAAETILARAEG